MPAKTWTILDVSENKYLDSGNHAEVLTLPGADGLAVEKYTKRGGLSDGVDIVGLSNGEISVRVLPTRGMSVWDMHHKGQRIGWQSPVRGPVHPKFVPTSEPSGLGWLDGFDELLVRCGLESNGAPEFGEDGKLKYPLHGRIGNKPAHKVEVTIDSDSREITVTGVVEETRFHFLKLRMTTTIKTKAGEAGFRIRDEIENLSGSPAEMQMLYHVNFGEPLLDGGSRFIAPLKTVVPRNDHAASGIATWDSYAAPQAGTEEQVYFMELLADSDGRTQSLLKNAHGTRGVSLHFNKQQLPCFTIWKNTTASIDGYVTGLEPGTNFPNPRTHEGQHGRVVKLPPEGKAAFDLQLTLHVNAANVEQAEKSIATLQAAAQPTIHNKPQSGWCA
jgi:hypothetical protein